MPPCRTDDSMYTPRSNITDSQYNSLKKEADNVTRLLCSVMGKIERNGPAEVALGLETINGLKEWWEHHKEVDRKRIAREVEDAEKALKNLSPEARKLLAERLGK